VVSKGRFFLHGIPLKGDNGERRAVANELQIRFGVDSLGSACGFGTLPQDDEYDRGYDKVMLAAIPAHFGRDIIDECTQSASKQRTAAEWLSFYFQNVKSTPTGLELDVPERPGWWVTIDGGTLERVPPGQIRLSRKAEFLGKFAYFRLSLFSLEGRDFVVFQSLPWRGIPAGEPQVAAIASEGKVVEATPEQETAVLASLGLAKAKLD